MTERSKHVEMETTYTQLIFRHNCFPQKLYIICQQIKKVGFKAQMPIQYRTAPLKEKFP